MDFKVPKLFENINLPQVGDLNDLVLKIKEPDFHHVNAISDEEQNEINASIKENIEAIHKTAENTRRTAEATETLEKELSVLRSELQKEHELRVATEAENMAYVKSQDRKNIRIAIAALIVGIVGVIIAFVALWGPFAR